MRDLWQEKQARERKQMSIAIRRATIADGLSLLSVMGFCYLILFV